MSDESKQAFPTAESENVHRVPGMTLREWYAGMALQGLLANPSSNPPTAIAVSLAIDHADALIAALDADKPAAQPSMRRVLELAADAVKERAEKMEAVRTEDETAAWMASAGADALRLAAADLRERAAKEPV